MLEYKSPTFLEMPEVHTDFISAMVAEEFGFLGLTVLLFMFWWLVMWGLRTALDSRDRFCRLASAGVAALFGWQVFVNAFSKSRKSKIGKSNSLTAQ
jgi:cell division protein FtsW